MQECDSSLPKSAQNGVKGHREVSSNLAVYFAEGALTQRNISFLQVIFVYVVSYVSFQASRILEGMLFSSNVSKIDKQSCVHNGLKRTTAKL